MPRDCTPAFLAAIQSPMMRCALLVDANFASGPAYMWNGVGNLTWNGHTYLGVGTLGSVSTIEEVGVVEAKGITISLSGIDATILSDVLSEIQQGLGVIVYLAQFDASWTLISDPVTSFAGAMDQPTISASGDTAMISIQCESPLVLMKTACDRRRTNEDLQLDHPGARGREFVNSIQERTIYWGRVPRGHNT